MADTGFLSPSVGSQGNQGLADWANPDFLIDEDFAYATVSVSLFVTSEKLVARSFGVSLPSGSTIDGIEVRAVVGEISYVEADGAVVNVFLTKNGDASNPTIAGGGEQIGETAGTTFTFGGSSDLWGSSWAEADVESANFGVLVQAVGGDGGVGGAVAEIDSIQAKIYYTEVSEPGNATATRVMRGGVGR